MSADVIDLAEIRRQRSPAPRPPPRMPPVGKRTGDRVRCLFSDQLGTVIGWETIGTFGAEELCLLSVILPSGTHRISELDVVATRIVSGGDVTPPCDVG